MPHCVLEYSQNLEQEVPPIDLMDAVKSACIASDLFSPEDIKLRGFPCKNFIPAGLEDAFIHVTIRLLSGRTAEQKSDLSNKVLESLMAFSLKGISLSVELCDIDRDSYVKKIVLSPSQD